VYEAGFIEHYAMPLLYPASLSREHQYVLGALVLRRRARRRVARGC